METTKIIGRKEEIRKLESCYASDEAKLVIVYGRRRVGKTYLISQTFKDRFTLRLTGAYNQPKMSQLENFADELRRVWKSDLDTPESWKSAFSLLRAYIESIDSGKRVLIFIDEIPWFDTHKSGFLPAFEYFWNSWGATRDNLMLIACGSATAWMTENFADNPGGLFNRHAMRIYLRPFTLHETEEYLQHAGFDWGRYDIAECYMVMGGIPFYLSQLDPYLTYTANIDALFFNDKTGLWDEFTHLYRTLFRNSENYVKVVEVLASKKSGMTRSEIAEAAKLCNNGDLSRILKNLCDSDFVTTYNFFGKLKKDVIYQLCDNFTLFYYHFIKDYHGRDRQYWTHTIDNPARKAWAGNAFELLCKSHIAEIKKALGISGILSEESIWFSKGDSNSRGAQIDLLIDRRDRVINVCEIKFSINPYIIDKEYELQLRNKLGVFRSCTNTTKALQLTMITTFGVKKNVHSGIVQSQVSLDDLFRE